MTRRSLQSERMPKDWVSTVTATVVVEAKESELLLVRVSFWRLAYELWAGDQGGSAAEAVRRIKTALARDKTTRLEKTDTILFRLVYLPIVYLPMKREDLRFKIGLRVMIYEFGMIKSR